ncbi:PREDICTED: F-box protein At2g32560-like isoform X2 [Populus euphratica]|uniref:F-box protein At2g32560-like isoform X2 n=1 Tax=Populus euphratica TaxID=75702 RepID=A0AAJ6UCL9_POPEU|nr:PREDICTED: F-box protein At2g32560-like isoform X2 [Populus euphratica]
MRSEGRMLSLGPRFWGEFSSFLVSWFNKGRFVVSLFQVPMKMPLKKVNLGSRVQEIVEEEEEEEEEPSLLDLPELALERILERLSPAGLCSMAGVCSSLRDRCRSDHLWEKHLKQKWGRVIGESAYKEWQWHIASSKRPSLLDQRNRKGFMGSLISMWPFCWFKLKCESRSKPKTCLPVDSIMALYLSLESGKFWFPAQVYNRENGHVGFMLSCYDAQLNYDSKTDTFQARYSPFARQTIEQSIHWERLRAPPVDTPAHVLHPSDCLNDLKPGDHIEIQWRRSKEFPYGWWYAVVGHQELCDGNENRCHCRHNVTELAWRLRNYDVYVLFFLLLSSCLIKNKCFKN